MKTARTGTLTLAAALAVAVAVAAACGGDTRGSDAPEAAQREGASERAMSARLVTAEFRVDGMTCGGCALATEISVKRLEGVHAVDAEFDEGTSEGRCTVEYDPAAVTTEQIAAAIERAGFTPALQRVDGSG